MCVRRPRSLRDADDPPISGDFDLDGVCAKELDVGVVVVEKRDDQAPCLVSFLYVKEFLLKTPLGV